MRLISPNMPAPRLLITVVPELRERAPEQTSMKSRLKGVSIFSGNGRAMFVGIILGAALLIITGAVHVRRQANLRQAEEMLRVLAISTRSVSAPDPTTVKISADLIHVSAISLGQPRLAIINGQLLGEGEQVVVHPPDTSVAVTLRVVKISDGNIELSNGIQVITVRQESSPVTKPKP